MPGARFTGRAHTNGMSRQEPLPTSLTSAPFTVSAARELGYGRGKLRSTQLARPFHGVRAPVNTGLFELCRAYATRMHPAHAFSHTTAAALWGMPLPRSLDKSIIHVSAPAPLRAPEGRRVSGHRLSGLVAVERWGIRVTPPALSWMHLSETLAVHDLVAAADFAITGSPFDNVLPIATLDELAAAHVSGASRGRRARAVALPLVQEGALSRPESLVRVLLVQAGIPSPRVNPSIVDARGSFVAMPDLAWPEFRFAIEYEGDHHRGVRQFRRDIRRIEALVDLRWSVMKVSADDLFDRPDELVARVLRRLTSHGWTPPRIELRHTAHFER